MSEKLRIVPIGFREASEFVRLLHRHNKPPAGCKFCIGVTVESSLVGVAQCGRPVSRVLDDGLTLEINRTCTDGYRNANSKLYGACRAVAKAMGYSRVITYTQAGESGSSLRAVGFVQVAKLPARHGWAESSKKLRHIREPGYGGGVDRVRWEIVFGQQDGTLQ